MNHETSQVFVNGVEHSHGYDCATIPWNKLEIVLRNKNIQQRITEFSLIEECWVVENTGVNKAGWIAIMIISMA